jgi:hypothetical protein
MYEYIELFTVLFLLSVYLWGAMVLMRIQDQTLPIDWYILIEWEIDGEDINNLFNDEV